MQFAVPHRSSSRHYPRIVDVDRFLRLVAEPVRPASSTSFYRELLTRRDALVRAGAEPRTA